MSDRMSEVAARLRHRGDRTGLGRVADDLADEAGQPLTTYRVTAVPVQPDALPAASAASAAAPLDRVRWGPVLAGLFAALSTLIALLVLGLAMVLSSYATGYPPSSFTRSAAYWGAGSAAFAFLVGGWLAARTAATRGRGSGLLHGVMVWAVALPLCSALLLAGGAGALWNVTPDEAARRAASQRAHLSRLAGIDLAAAQAAGGAEAAGGADAPDTAVAVAPAAASPGRVAWNAFAVLALTLVAAGFGGLVGARVPPRRA